MNRVRRIFSLFTVLVFVMTTALPALAASEYEDAMAKSMQDALVKTGMQPKKAAGVTQQNVFFGIVMMKDVQKHLLDDQREKLVIQAGRVGGALGTALGSAFRVYGDKKMQETPAIMMHAVRAGMVPEAASETFAALAQSGYAFDAAMQIIHEASEVVRSAKLADAGVDLCRGIRKIVAQKGSVQELQKEIVQVARAEKARQQALLAKNAKERSKRDGGNGPDRDAVANNQGGARAASGAGSKPGLGSSARASDGSVSSPGGRAAGSAAASTGSGASTASGTAGGKTDAGKSDASSGGSTGGSASGAGSSGSGSGSAGGSSSGAGSSGADNGGTGGSSSGAGASGSGSGSAGGSSSGAGSSGSGSGSTGGSSSGAGSSGADSGSSSGSSSGAGSSGADSGSSGGSSSGAGSSGSGSGGSASGGSNSSSNSGSANGGSDGASSGGNAGTATK